MMDSKDIERENEKLMNRLISRTPIISAKQQEKDY